MLNGCKKKSSWTKLPNFYKCVLLPDHHARYFSASQGKHSKSLSENNLNKSAKYVLFMCPNPWNGNLTQVGSRSFLGSWELLGIFKSLFVFTLENQALASAPLNPLLRTQRQRRGMLNVNGQTAPAPSERERWRYKAAWGARSETVLTLLKVSISTNCKRSLLADPDLWTMARPANENVRKYSEKYVKTNKINLMLYGSQESELHLRWMFYRLKIKFLNLPYNSKFVDVIKALLIAYCAAQNPSFHAALHYLSPACVFKTVISAMHHGE